MTSSNSHSGSEDFKACRSEMKFLLKKEEKERVKEKNKLLGLERGDKALTLFSVKKRRM